MSVIKVLKFTNKKEISPISEKIKFSEFDGEFVVLVKEPQPFTLDQCDHNTDAIHLK